ncbi:MAG: hypothetical protein CMP51_01975 [Flavobacteriales bacterium]|nr:hypothetical protein [Flavobacteriales bacterium]|tara:strand:- start:3275 stop:4024 length:750 start_codon:yes stop_codon:yes gene_type:complete
MIYKILSILLFANFGLAQSHFSIPKKEKVTYSIKYGLINGGSASLSMNYHNKESNTYRIVGKGESNYFINLFFPVKETYLTEINKTTLLPIYFYANIIEGNFKKTQELNYFHKENVVQNINEEKFTLTDSAHNFLSAFFYYKNLLPNKLEENYKLKIPLFFENTGHYIMEVIFLKEELVSTKFGDINCLKFMPKVIPGRIFKNETDLTIWISNDPNRLLIKVEMGILVGKIYAIINSYENIKFPLSINE